MNKYKDKLVCMDLDGTLCKGDCWTEEEMLFAEPIQKNIDKNNKLYLTNHIIIYTARPEWYRAETVYWLSKNKVRYHALVMGDRKVGADIYYDDKAREL